MSGAFVFTQDRHPVNLCIDPNQRLRISQASDIFGCKQSFDEQPLFFSTAVTGGGTIVYSNATQSSRLSVTTAGDSAIRQTRRYMNYQAGKAQQAMGGVYIRRWATGWRNQEGRIFRRSKWCIPRGGGHIKFSGGRQVR